MFETGPAANTISHSSERFFSMTMLTRRLLSHATFCVLLFASLATLAAGQNTTEISSSPSSLSFSSTFVGKASGSKVITITNQTSNGLIIEKISFDCGLGYGIASGIAPFSMGQTQKITHYSIFFQPLAAQSYPCNFVLTLNDGSSLAVPLTGTGASSGAVAQVTPTSLSFPNQQLGSTSASQNVTIKNNGTSNLTLSAINLSPPDFTTNTITLPASIVPGASKQISVSYTPSQTLSETGAIDFTFNEVPDVGSSLTGNGVASTTLAVSTFPILPQATQSAAYQMQLATSGGTGPFTWNVAGGSNLPSGLSLSSSGLISGTLASSVNAGTYTFTVQVTDSATSNTDNATLTLGVFANLGDNCNDTSFDVPGTSSPIVALNDLGTGTYQGSEGGLYPNGSNARPSSHDGDGVSLADGIQPLDANGNPSDAGKMVLMAIGESTAQNEFNRFLPIANSDPAKNPALVIVNGAQGGATPNNFTSTTSAYWATVMNNYLPQNNVTAQQVVAVWIEDTDGIASGTFPSDISNLQSQYETMMQTMLTLFPNLKLVYFSSRVYGGYSNGVGNPDNPEPFAYEVGFAVKWAIQDQINGNANLNYNSANGPVVAPWMSWGPYYWSNGMLGRNDGLMWDCADFSNDGTHPSSQFGQLKVATSLLQFLKTDNTTTPWYLAPNRMLMPTSGANQSGAAGTQLALPLTATATNNGNPVSGVVVSFTDSGAGGTFGSPSVTTGANGQATTTYTLPSTAQTVTVSATNSKYSTASFIESATAPSDVLAVNGGNNQTGAAGTTLPTSLSVLATINGNPASGVSVSFSDGGAGGNFGTQVATTNSSGIATTTYTLPSTAKTVTISASSSGYTSATFSETATAAVQTLAVNAGNNQTGTVSTTLPVALSVLATNNGNPASGVSVTFSDGGAGGTFGTPTGTTNSSGIASTTYTLPSTAKTITVSATATGYSAATFTETSTATATQVLSVCGGNNQTGNTGATLPVNLCIASTKSGKLVQNVTVTFSDNGAGGTFGTTTLSTGSSGKANTTYTLPATAGTVTITVTATGYTSGTFTETAAGTTVSTLVVSSGARQTGTVGAPLPNPIVVTAKNSSGKPVAGASVSFSDGGVGGSFSPNPAITATNGTATTVYTTPTVPKTSITVTATSGTASVSLTEKAVAGSPANLSIVSGNNQTGNHSAKLSKNLVVLVTDQFSNPVQGVTVSFVDNGAGGTFSNANPVTTASGQVSVSYTAGPNPGTVTISASTSALGPANFTETIH
jgi:hypothetical protein